MKKLIILFMLLGSIASPISAQKKTKSSGNSSNDIGPHAFKKGGVDLNIGLGLGRWGARYYTNYSPPINLALDIGVSDNVNLGAFFAYSRSKYSFHGNDLHQGNLYQYSYSYKYSFYTVGLRGAYHFGDLIGEENLDVYVGGMIGNSFVKYSYTYDDPYQSRNDIYSSSSVRGRGFVWGLYGGARYFFTKKVGIYGEFGWGLSYANIGLTLKIK